MKKTLLAIGIVFGIPLSLFWLNGALRLISTASDMAVLLGYLMIGLPVAALALWAWKKVAKGSPQGPALLVIAFACLMSSGCYSTVGPGHVGILVEQTGSQRGVQDFPVKTGRVFYNPINETVLEYPTYVQTAIWTKAESEGRPQDDEISFQSKEGIHFTADVNCSYELQDSLVPSFYVKFRSDDIDAFTHGFMRNSVRNSFDIATQYTAEEINGDKQGELIKKVEDDVRAFMKPFGVNIVRLGFAAPPRPPDQVKNAIEGKVAAIQDAEKIKNQVQSSLNEGEKMKALANAQAQANQITQQSITPTLIEWEKVKKWDGHLPQVQGGVTPMIQIH